MLRVEAEWSQGLYYLVRLHTPDGTSRIVAQGTKAMCERVAAGKSPLVRQAELFNRG